ncbi:MAG: hypothetical protein KatS3mg129_1507 [Leptospiraceae bacterium]|nr:MAG: hypothetical protein KatS3mg129_1507 [Leptospiraceae bacterium]
MNFFDKLQFVIEKLNENIYEREDIIKFALLALFSGENMFLLGPPGVAKSLISRKIKYVIKNATYFEHLMTQYTLPEEVFGPISLPKLKQGLYEREINGYLPTSEVAFLDEIWKSSSSILNTLLVIINEKKFKQGAKEIDVPLQILISASNELPEDESLKALWDRFLIRIYVEPIKDREAFYKFLQQDNSQLYLDNIPEEYKFTKQEIQAVRKKINEIQLDHNVISLIEKIKDKFKQRNQENSILPAIEVSDRRWGKIINVLKTYALLNKRSKVSIMDCMILPYMVWNTVEEIEEIKQIIQNTILEELKEKNQHLNKIYKDSEFLENIINIFEKTEKDKLSKEIEYKTFQFPIISETFDRIYEKEYYCLKPENSEEAEFYISVNDIDFKRLSSINKTKKINVCEIRPLFNGKEKVYFEVPYTACIEYFNEKTKQIQINLIDYKVSFLCKIDTKNKYYVNSNVWKEIINNYIKKDKEQIKKIILSDKTKYYDLILSKFNDIIKSNYPILLFDFQHKMFKNFINELNKAIQITKIRAGLIYKFIFQSKGVYK